MAGSVLIAALSASFLAGIEQNPDVPDSVTSQATVQLASGVPFVSDTALQEDLTKAGASPEVSAAVVDANRTARIEGLDTALAVLALIALIPLFFTRRIPSTQPGSPGGGSEAPPAASEPDADSPSNRPVSPERSVLECAYDLVPALACPARPRLRHPPEPHAHGLHARRPGGGAGRLRADGGVGCERARGGVGLIVTGGIAPNDEARPYPGGAKLSSEDELPGHRVVTEAVHAAGGRIALQILHFGGTRITPTWSRPVRSRRRSAPRSRGN